METRVTSMLAALVASVATQVACMDREPAPVCPVPVELNQTEAMVDGYSGVDMLVMVDNSGSMAEEQAILATAFFPLVNSLVNPLPYGWQYPAADDVRVAVISSDMGLQWGGNPYQDGDGWPDDKLPPGCSSVGDDGRFQTYSDGKVVDIQNDTIPCASGGAQCPTGWTCGNIDGVTGIGVCQAPDGDGAGWTCPPLAATWAETTGVQPDPSLAFQVSCLSALGTSGCGFEQQLQSAAVALDRDDQRAFVRKGALLSVLMVTDEEDCSIESNGLFQVPEIQNLGDRKVNIACNLPQNEQHLYDTGHYRDLFLNAAGVKNGTVFAAIVGVPPDSGCEGPGSFLDGCLDHPDMQNTPVQEETASGPAWFFKPACTRLEGEQEVTKARPGRRFVSLARSFFEMGYVYSICQPDWSPAMNDIARLIAARIAGTCYPKPLDWDPATRQARCDVVVQYEFESEDDAKCPSIFEAEDPVVEERIGADDVKTYVVFCPLPRIPAEKECSANDFGSGALKDGFGWYYCENMGEENFNQACDDGLDNDGDGLTDCDDQDGCGPCQVCGGNGMDCKSTCKYKVELTGPAKAEVFGQGVAVQCLQQFSFTDPNCQENSVEACNDDRDNDGNGIWDCENVTGGDRPRYADFHCCPMHVGDDNRCVVDDHGLCAGSSNGSPSDACLQHASLLGCEPPWND